MHLRVPVNPLAVDSVRWVPKETRVTLSPGSDVVDDIAGSAKTFK